jgi:hypothetical protein
MDIEWAKDGISGELYIVQARPETVQSRRNPNLLKTFKLKGEGRVVAKGTAVGHSIATGKARVLESVSQMHQFEKGEILVTEIVRLISPPSINRSPHTHDTHTHTRTQWHTVDTYGVGCRPTRTGSQFSRRPRL